MAAGADVAADGPWDAALGGIDCADMDCTGTEVCGAVTAGDDGDGFASGVAVCATAKPAANTAVAKLPTTKRICMLFLTMESELL